MRQVQLSAAGCSLFLFAFAAASHGAIHGRVLGAGSVPVENARVTAPDGEAHFTDVAGRFTFPDLDPPTELVVSHPRFLDAVVDVDRAEGVEVRLEPKQEIFQEIAVSATKGETSYAPSSSSASVIDVERLAAPAATLTDVVATAPGVAENGQGGIFQTYSIRGVARQRVLTLLSGMRIIGERRAGVSASFIDPGLMGKVDVLRGPSSTYYGSGALGGVIQMFPRTFESATVEVGYDGNGDGTRQLVGWGDGSWSLGLAHRRSDNGETPGGLELNDHFDQASAVVSRSWRRRQVDYSFQLMASRGDDIGKSNTDFPQRVTNYPQERHLLVRFALRGEAGWGLDAWVHPNDLETRVLRDGFETVTANEAFDLGFNWYSRRQWGEHSTLRYGAEYFGRRKVEARETIQPLSGRGPVIEQTPLDGGEDELGVYGAWERNWRGTVFLLGGRLVVLRQRQVGFDTREESALTGFAGVVVPLKSGFELALNVGSGLRFPSLSERFFTGVTPRGFVEGNPELDAERSLSTDLALRYYGTRLFLSAGLFRTRVEDYVERVEIVDDGFTAVNLVEGDLTGFELDGAYRLGAGWSLGFGGHAVEGRSGDSEPLADVPADQLFVRTSWSRAGWSLSQRWEHRFAKNDPGSGENAIAAADLVSLSIGRELRGGLSLRLAGRNLLDESYFNSADDKVQLARGRSLSVAVVWSG